MFKTVFKWFGYQPIPKEETKDATINGVIRTLMDTQTVFDDNISWLVTEKKLHLNQQLCDFAEKVDFFMTSLISCVGLAKDRERAALLKTKIAKAKKDKI